MERENTLKKIIKKQTLKREKGRKPFKKKKIMGDNSVKNKKHHQKQRDNLRLKTISERQPDKK
jgi:hypothetical protein